MQQLIGGNRIFKNKVVRKNTKQVKQSVHCSLGLSRLNNLCCKQVKQTELLQSYRTKETIQIFHNLTYKSENLFFYFSAIYTNFSDIHLNNHGKDAKSQGSILACQRTKP